MCTEYKSEVRLSRSASTLAYKVASYNEHRHGVPYPALEVPVNIYEYGPIYGVLLTLFIVQKTLPMVSGILPRGLAVGVHVLG